MSQPCELLMLVDEYFSSAISPENEQKMRGHLVSCDDCRSHYEQRSLREMQRDSLLAQKIHTAPEPSTEAHAAPRPDQGANQGINPNAKRIQLGTRRPAVASYVGPIAGVILIGATLVIYLKSPKDVRDAAVGPTASVGGVAHTNAQSAPKSAFLHVVRAAPAGPANALSSPSIDTIKPDDALAFAIENRDAKKYVMVFGVNDRGQTYWFYPAVGRDADDARAIPIGHGPMLQQLPDAGPHHFDGTHLDVHALFLDDPKSARDIQKMIGGDSGVGGGAPLTIAAAVDHVTSFDIKP